MDLTAEPRRAGLRRENLWAVVLAGGSGARVRSFFTDSEGRRVPKQFCALAGDGPLVRRAIDRAAGAVPADHVVVIVTEEHRQWWQRQLGDLPPRNLVVQPCNRGTAVGLLLPLIEVLRRDPLATVLVLPSDHYVASERRLAGAIACALRAAQEDPRRLVLLGMTPHEIDTEYGWIVPSGPSAFVQRVARFVEKPDRPKASDLRRQGALLNSLIFAGSGRALLGLYVAAARELVDVIVPLQAEDARHGAMEESFRSLPSFDFSRQILERSAERLSVVRVPDCGWTDLGTPERLERFRQGPGAISKPQAMERSTALPS
jgi:mannose-1-phosphate guanylyltransferase